MRLRSALTAIVAMAAVMVAVPADVGAYPPTGAGIIEGQATLWGTGEPVAGVEVRAWRSGFWTVMHTDADGYYRFDLLEPEDYRISFHRVEAENEFWYYPGSFDFSDAESLTITDDEVFSGIDGAIQDEGTMIGRVVDDITGLPVAGICGDIHRGGLIVEATALSNVDGWLRYPGLTVGTGPEWSNTFVRLHDCNSLGYVDEWYRDVPRNAWEPSSVVEYMTGRGRFQAEIGRPATIAGTVTNDEGEGLNLCITLWFGESAVALTVSDLDGHYELADLTESDGYAIDFEDCSRPRVYRTLYRVPAAAVSGTTTYYDVMLESVASIAGTVTDASTGLPLEGICVLGTEEWFMSSHFDVDTTDAAGRYSLAVPVGTSEQYVRAYWCGETPRPYEEQWWDGVTTFEEAADLQVVAYEHRTGVDLALPKMASLRGTLTGADGLPAESYIRLEPQFEGARWAPSGSSEPDGTYRIDNIEAGAYRLRFGDDGETSTYVQEWYDDVLLEEDAATVTSDWADEVTIDAELDQVGVLEWDFVLFADVYPTVCTYLADTNGGIVAEHSGRVDRHAELGGIAAGDYLLFAEDCDGVAPELAPVWFPDAATRAGATVLTVDGDLTDLAEWFLDEVVPPPSTVSGRTTEGGEPWDACVTVFDEEMTTVGETVAVDGDYLAADLTLRGPEAELLVRAADCADPTRATWFGGATQAEAILFGLGIDFAGVDMDIEAEVVAPVTYPLAVVVDDVLGRPLKGVCIAVSGDATAEAVTDGDGVAYFELLAGDYVVISGGDGPGCLGGYEESAAAVIVTGPANLEVDLALAVAFEDTDSTVFAAAIEWLGGSGITRGCNPPLNSMFCPDSVVTRGQMAAFLVRALGLSDGGGGNSFVDDDGSVFEADIAKLAAAKITLGCNPPVNDRFCPDAAVTRGQLAAFLVRALGLSGGGGGNSFVDDDGSVFEADIAKLAAAEITLGCNPPTNDRFCPRAPVTRGQMAAFLYRALG